MLNINSLTPESIDYAIERLLNWNKVNRHLDTEEKSESLYLVMESLGMSAETFTYLAEALMEILGAKRISAGVLGVMVGLAMAEHGEEQGG